MARERPNEDPGPPSEEEDAPCGCEEAQEVMSPPPGRVRAAWSVLRGQNMVPAQIQAEWMDYKLIFNDILGRLGAQLARQAKAEHKRLKKEIAASGPEAIPAPVARRDKSELRRRAAQLRGLGTSIPFQGGDA